MKSQIIPKPLTLTGSEAIFGFVAWLTSRERPTIFSANHNAGEAVELIRQFLNANNLENPRSNYTDYLSFPTDS